MDYDLENISQIKPFIPQAALGQSIFITTIERKLEQKSVLHGVCSTVCVVEPWGRRTCLKDFKETIFERSPNAQTIVGCGNEDGDTGRMRARGSLHQAPWDGFQGAF